MESLRSQLIEQTIRKSNRLPRVIVQTVSSNLSTAEIKKYSARERYIKEMQAVPCCEREGYNALDDLIKRS